MTTTVRIKENSLLAKLAAKTRKSNQMALVLGSTIRLHNVSREEFLKNTKWVRHKVAHVKQFQQKGYCRFIVSYLLETFNLGYEHNRYEVEAKHKEKDHGILDNVVFSWAFSITTQQSSYLMNAISNKAFWIAAFDRKTKNKLSQLAE